MRQETPFDRSISRSLAAEVTVRKSKLLGSLEPVPPNPSQAAARHAGRPFTPEFFVSNSRSAVDCRRASRPLGTRILTVGRYADDCNIYVQSERAGQRVRQSLTAFLEQRLKLKVDAAKSAAATGEPG
jgi:hypothetical protein